jgi:hypothetical protein
MERAGLRVERAGVRRLPAAAGRARERGRDRDAGAAAAAEPGARAPGIRSPRTRTCCPAGTRTRAPATSRRRSSTRTSAARRTSRSWTAWASREGRIVLARYGGNFRGYKVQFAEEHGAAASSCSTTPASQRRSRTRSARHDAVHGPARLGADAAVDGRSADAVRAGAAARRSRRRACDAWIPTTSRSTRSRCCPSATARRARSSTA